MEIRDRVPVSLKLYAAAFIGMSAASVSYLCIRSLRKEFIISNLIRATRGTKYRHLKDGDYVRLEGKVSCGTVPFATVDGKRYTEEGRIKPLKAPQSKVECTVYRFLKYRVLEEKSTTTFSGGGNKKSKPGWFKRLIFGSPVVAPSSNSTSIYAGGVHTQDNWKEHELEISNIGKEIKTFIEDDEGNTILVDLTGAEYFSLETVYNDYEPVERSLEAMTSRRTIAIRTIEKVLPVDKDIIIFGEIKKRGGMDSISIQRPIPRYIFEQKTSIYKPFIISLMSEHELLVLVEDKAKVNAITSALSGSIALPCLGYCAFKLFERWLNRSSISTPQLVQ